MNLEITPAEREPPTALFQLYAYDFSEILGIDVEDDGRFHVPAIDPYFGQPKHHALAPASASRRRLPWSIRQATRSRRAGTCLCQGVPAKRSRSSAAVSSLGATPGVVASG